MVWSVADGMVVSGACFVRSFVRAGKKVDIESKVERSLIAVDDRSSSLRDRKRIVALEGCVRQCSGGRASVKGFERRLSLVRFGSSDRQATDGRDCRPLKERSSLSKPFICNGLVKAFRPLEARDNDLSEWKFEVIETIYKYVYEYEIAVR